MKKNKINYTSIDQFSEDGIYITKDGQSVRINGIEDGKIRFVLNESINDMQSEDNFLAMMNGKEYSVFNF